MHGGHGGYLKSGKGLAVAVVVALQAALHGGFDGGAVLLLAFAFGLAVEEGAGFGFGHDAFAVVLFELLHGGEEGVFVTFVLGGSGLAGGGVDGDLEAVFQVAQALLLGGLGGRGLGEGGDEGGEESQGTDFHLIFLMWLGGREAT